jgi:hypothetical protein
MPESYILSVKKLAMHSFLFSKTNQLVIALFVFAAFLIIHQYLCWVWLVHISEEGAAENKAGKAAFLYSCAGLFVLTVGIVFWSLR